MNLWNPLESPVSSANPKYWATTYQANRYDLEKIVGARCTPYSRQSQMTLTAPIEDLAMRGRTRFYRIQ